MTACSMTVLLTEHERSKAAAYLGIDLSGAGGLGEGEQIIRIDERVSRGRTEKGRADLHQPRRPDEETRLQGRIT